MSNIVTTDRIRPYVQALYQLMPRSGMWSRLFNAPELLFKEVAENDPELSSPYNSTPDENVPVGASTMLGRFLSIFGIQLMKTDEAIYRLPEESTPTTATDTLTNWEIIYDVPRDGSLTDQQRRDRLGIYFNSRGVPRSFAELKNIALAYGAVIELENQTAPEWSGMLGTETDPGMEAGTWTLEKVDWGGKVLITVVSIGSVPIEQFIPLMEREIYTSAMIIWDLTAIGGDITMTTDNEDIIVMTTENDDVIILNP